jgi:hypothetical protein
VSERIFSNDAKSFDTLRRAAQALGVPSGASNQTKLDAIRDHCIASINTLAQGQLAAEQSPTVGME